MGMKSAPQALTITRERLLAIITEWELEAQRNPPDHTYDTPEYKTEYLWQKLKEACHAHVD